VAPGRGVLVHAGASGVGLAAIQVAKLCGARVAATTRTAAKLGALAAAGADLAIDAGGTDFAAEIEGRWGRDAVDVVLDPIGAAGDGRLGVPAGAGGGGVSAAAGEPQRGKDRDRVGRSLMYLRVA